MRNFLFAPIALLASFAAWGSEPGPNLRSYPTPSQAIEDVAKAQDQPKPEVLAGRQAGRLLMLANTLAYGYSSSGNISSAPAETRRLHEEYQAGFKAIQNEIQSRPEWRKQCGYFSRLLETCFKDNYNYAKAEFQHGSVAAMDAAGLYFPAAEQARFIALADPHGLGEKYRTRGDENERKRNVNIISLACIGLGLVALLKALVSGYRMGKYRFENTTDAGAIRYDSYKGFLGDRFKAVGIALSVLLGLFLLAIGVGIRIFI